MRNDLAHYTCYRTAGPIQIDGKLDEPSWQIAPKSEPFVDIVTGEPAWFDTRVALLWDDQCLYFGFTAEEPQVRGYLTERDARIYEDNDVEVFIAGENAYYEFEINALNTIYEVFWIWKDALAPGSPYHGRPEFDPTAQRTMVLDGVGGHVHPRGERWGFLDWDFPGLRHAVHVEPPGWSVELALPWEGLRGLADGRALPPRAGRIQLPQPPARRFTNHRLRPPASFSSGARKRSSLALPMAIATLRRKPLYRARGIGLARNISRNSSSESAASFSSGGAKCAAAKAGSSVTGARRFHGHTSWQISQPKTWRPMAGRASSGAAPRSSMVKYEMHSRESSAHSGPSARPVGTMACVGQASMQRVHEPQRSGGGWSGASPAKAAARPEKTRIPWPG
jgi:hypothetical protein